MVAAMLPDTSKSDQHLGATVAVLVVAHGRQHEEEGQQRKDRRAQQAEQRGPQRPDAVAVAVIHPGDVEEAAGEAERGQEPPDRTARKLRHARQQEEDEDRRREQRGQRRRARPRTGRDATAGSRRSGTGRRRSGPRAPRTRPRGPDPHPHRHGRAGRGRAAACCSARRSARYCLSKVPATAPGSRKR